MKGDKKCDFLTTTSARGKGKGTLIVRNRVSAQRQFMGEENKKCGAPLKSTGRKQVMLSETAKISSL